MQKQVILNPGQSGRVAFTVTPNEAGIYQATLDGLSGSFEVLPVFYCPYGCLYIGAGVQAGRIPIEDMVLLSFATREELVAHLLADHREAGAGAGAQPYLICPYCGITFVQGLVWGLVEHIEAKHYPLTTPRCVLAFKYWGPTYWYYLDGEKPYTIQTFLMVEGTKLSYAAYFSTDPGSHHFEVPAWNIDEMFDFTNWGDRIWFNCVTGERVYLPRASYLVTTMFRG